MMKTVYTKKFSYIGAGIGVALFAFFGLLYGSFIGGVIGLHIVNAVYDELFGGGAIIARIIVALGMISGILIACVLSVVGCAAVGRVGGYILDRVLWSRERAYHRKAFVIEEKK